MLVPMFQAASAGRNSSRFLALVSEMADKRGLGPEVKELRLGSSFTNKGSAFHTFRCESNNTLHLCALFLKLSSGNYR